MNCQDISRALDSRNVNALSAAERRALDAHAASCPTCGPEWIVYSRLAGIPAAPMPQKLAARCEALAAEYLKASGRRRTNRTVLLGALFVVAAAAAVIVTRMYPSGPVHLRTANPDVTAPATSPAGAGAGVSAPAAALPPGGSEARPVIVSLELIQKTDDATGQAFGLQVYERARQELRALSGVVLVDAAQDGADKSSLHMTYTNYSTTGTDFPPGPYGMPVGANNKVDELFFGAQLMFEVENVQSDSDERGMCAAAREVTASGEPRTIRQSCVGRMVYSSGAGFLVPAECIGLRTDRCHTTASDVAATTILGWRLETTPPDAALEERLHAMLQAPTPPGLRVMPFNALVKHKRLRLEAGELRSVADLILVADDPAVRDELVKASMKVGNGSDLLRHAKDLVFRDKPNGVRETGFQTRQYLVRLIGNELRSQPESRSILESIAVNDPYFDVREEAKRALGDGTQTD